ncbi:MULTISPECIES: GAF domain-containing protein [unclassified Streptomyces]|uniref:GAF domain-containing protein n=1 Tax=unclassified Streptomyces TaxID=2593676 RepID=UPI00224CB0AF|nr:MULTISPECIES: GAF domain-containing protein [unclassified Streptomyces]MCX5144433.1 GAF domain-containing protein [Streptomyces sp. NBC_00338]WRZ68790.1 GAF domain-containing protein [Streptomyces sp. NBC_01257]WSU62751.1 GAF domain-containing protein [Streptomyces sp. NBC_01104]
MTTSHTLGRLLLTPVDSDARVRTQRLRSLGLGERPDASFDNFDAFADRVAEVTEVPFSMVNFIDGNRQFYAGLHTPAGTRKGSDLGAAAAGSGRGGRYVALDHGYCPHVVVRRKALVLEDVCDYPRFAGNPVVDDIGIRSYLGAPLIDRTGIALGAVCAVDIVPRPWGRAGLDTIKSLAQELVGHIHRREDNILGL